LGYCEHTTDAGLQALTQQCTGLTRLDLEGLLITDAGLQALAQQCAGLTRLNVSDCERITEAGAEALEQDYPHIDICIDTIAA
jgi:Leucine Rich repeat